MSKWARTGRLWLKWFPLALLPRLQLSDFNQWPVAAPPTCPAINLPPPLDECVTARGMFQLKNSLCRSSPSSATDQYAFDIFIKKERKHVGKYVSFLTAQTKVPELEEDGGLWRGKDGRGWGGWGAVLSSTFEIPELCQVDKAVSQTTESPCSLRGCSQDQAVPCGFRKQQANITTLL